MKKKILARKILLPTFTFTELSEVQNQNTSLVQLKKIASFDSYHVRHKKNLPAIGSTNLNLNWTNSNFNLFPVVLDKSGAPWAEAMIFLISQIEERNAPAMSTFASIADSLTAYRRFIDESEIDWTIFPSNKMRRPTYIYHGTLKLSVAAGEIQLSTAKRRIGVVISFYEWLIAEKVLTPAFAPWKETDKYVQLTDGNGFRFSKKIISRDVSFKTQTQIDPYDQKITDGGKLRPLPVSEQEWLIDALLASGNTEMLLIHLLGITTGARIQSILTMRIKHLNIEINEKTNTDVRLKIGPGTGVDTKNDKALVLHIPTWFYKMLKVYSKSPRATRRRKLSKAGDHENQYIFLSQRGESFYSSKLDYKEFNEKSKIRYLKTGQAIRQFIKEKIIPFIRKKYDAPDFHFQFHDTRATFGMNMTDSQLALVANKKITLHQAREFVKARLGHSSTATTDNTSVPTFLIVETSVLVDFRH
ncbi:hypothetical protein UNDKW_4048 [Undibacterium sp. KW1]|uniref:integrase n=1 Tax=Undibacterium sp. KW1 TaxID=2058624 RepID=UPI001331E000|nr:integrase [Undibacterium sp. KW1]BBB62321.1 hypothetical protein UNDKW_4048 [Undibacterium sp. KW1]